MINELEYELIDEVIEDLPASAAFGPQANRYGSIAGLDDEELADPEELERVAFLRDFEPVLSLPVKRKEGWIRPSIDESGRIEWGAFGTVDFERLWPGFHDRSRYREEKLREELRDMLITIGIVKERLADQKYQVVLKHLQMGLIKMEHITNEDVRCMAKLVRQADRLKKQLEGVRNKRRLTAR